MEGPHHKRLKGNQDDNEAKQRRGIEEGIERLQKTWEEAQQQTEQAAIKAYKEALFALDMQIAAKYFEAQEHLNKANLALAMAKALEAKAAKETDSEKKQSLLAKAKEARAEWRAELTLAKNAYNEARRLTLERERYARENKPACSTEAERQECDRAAGDPKISAREVSNLGYAIVAAGKGAIKVKGMSKKMQKEKKVAITKNAANMGRKLSEQGAQSLQVEKKTAAQNVEQVADATAQVAENTSQAANTEAVVETGNKTQAETQASGQLSVEEQEAALKAKLTAGEISWEEYTEATDKLSSTKPERSADSPPASEEPASKGPKMR